MNRPTFDESCDFDPVLGLDPNTADAGSLRAAYVKLANENQQLKTQKSEILRALRHYRNKNLLLECFAPSLAVPVYLYRRRGHEAYITCTPGRYVELEGKQELFETRIMYDFEAAEHPDDAAVDSFAAAMKAKLAKKRDAGKHGWQGAAATHLSALLRLHVDKGDPVDVGNLAMMLHQNGQRIEGQPTRRKTPMSYPNGLDMESMPGMVEPRSGHQQPAPDVEGLVDALSESLKGIETPSVLTHARAEFFKAGVHAAVNQLNTVLAAHRKQGGGA